MDPIIAPLIPIILTKAEKIEADVMDIKVTIAANAADLKYHIKRTNDLQTIVEDLHRKVEPLYVAEQTKIAIEHYKKNSRADLIYKLKLPAYIVAALTAIGTALAWIMSK